MVKCQELSQELRMKVRLATKGDKYAIYQVKPEDPENMTFFPLAMLKEKNITPTIEKYEMVYAGNLPEGMENCEDLQPMLDRLYCKFNNQRPEDFQGHSMSVSDVVGLRIGDKASYWYVDSVGFVKIPFVEEAAV